MAREVRPLRDLFTKSVVAAADLPAGTVLQAKDLRLKKPGTGIPGDRFAQVVGARLVRGLKADELIQDRDLEVVQ